MLQEEDFEREVSENYNLDLSNQVLNLRSGKKIKLDEGGQHKIIRNENFEIDFRKSKESFVRMAIN